MIYWITEMPSMGKVLRNHKNCRTEFAWFISSDGTVLNYGDLLDNTYAETDVIIFIIPKREDYVRNIVSDKFREIVSKIPAKIGIMQEGPSTYWLDYPLDIQIQFYNFCSNLDFILSHNEIDAKFYRGFFPNVPVYVNHSLMIEDTITDVNWQPEDKTIIGGNFVNWYGGFQSYSISSEFGCPVSAPSMGRMDKREQELDINHLPYMQWDEWIYSLSKFKYAIHLMPTVAAGTFSLNCGYFGIPCIGNVKIDTQRLLYPDLSIDVNDLHLARALAIRLKSDSIFYADVSQKAYELYRSVFSESNWLRNWNEILTNIKKDV